jgi:hypothetical protein
MNFSKLRNIREYLYWDKYRRFYTHVLVKLSRVRPSLVPFIYILVHSQILTYVHVYLQSDCFFLYALPDDRLRSKDVVDCKKSKRRKFS